MASKKKQILVVDDEPSWLKSVSHILRKEGYQVKAVQSSAEALVLLAGRFGLGRADFPTAVSR